MSGKRYEIGKKNEPDQKKVDSSWEKSKGGKENKKRIAGKKSMFRDFPKK